MRSCQCSHIENHNINIMVILRLPDKFEPNSCPVISWCHLVRRSDIVYMACHRYNMYNAMLCLNTESEWITLVAGWKVICWWPQRQILTMSIFLSRDGTVLMSWLVLSRVVWTTARHSRLHCTTWVSEERVTGVKLSGLQHSGNYHQDHGQGKHCDLIRTPAV